MHISLSTRSGGLVKAVGLVCLLAGAAGLQAQTNTGGIRGSVFDETMGAVPGATVRTVEENRGVERQSLTSETGEFAFTYLDPGVYSLSIEAEGFAPLTIEGLEVRVGENATVSPQLALAATEELVVVTAESARSAIEPERVQQSDHIDSVRIQNLPINRRDYLDLALLAPAVVDASYVANATDRRIAATPTSGLGIGGTNGRGNTFMIDGLDNGFNTGAVRSAISQEAVQEFQVSRNSFSTEQGGAPGGAVNIATKSGTNELHGSLFGVLRNRRFQARNHFDPGKGAYARAQSGASAGGPIKRNKTFLFSAYERLDRHESQIVPLLADKSFLTSLPESQQQLVDALSTAGPAAIQPLVSQIATSLVPGNYPEVISIFEENSGVFPFSEERQQFVVRLDHAPRDGRNTFWRGNWTRQDARNTSFGALIARNRGCDTPGEDFSVAFGDTVVISPQWVSETRLGFSRLKASNLPTDPDGPAIDINGFGNFGRDFILPTAITERVFQVRQNLIRVTGRQTLKFGADFNFLHDNIRSETFLGGRFVFGEAIPLANIIDGAAGPGTSSAVKALLGAVGAGHLAGNVDLPVSSLQAFALGLPIICQQGFGDPCWTGWATGSTTSPKTRSGSRRGSC